MRRRLNYTNRQRIRQSDLAFTILEDDAGLPKFHADIDLMSYNLPEDAKVWVEAYDRNSFMRFPFGSVQAMVNESSTTLSAFAGTDSYYFRVKVVDDKEHARLYAVADSVSPVRHDDDDAGKSLLRVTTRDLGPVPWELEYKVSDHPLLVINNQIDAGKSLPRSNQFFQALVFPAIVEQILRHILLEDRYRPSAQPDDDDMWKESWLEFAGTLPGNTRLPFEQEISDDDLGEWIEGARRSFCQELNAIRKVRLELREVE
jgi:hypothetical protein